MLGKKNVSRWKQCGVMGAFNLYNTLDECKQARVFAPSEWN